MPDISHTITYVFLFTSLYFEVFILVTYLEHRKTIKKENQMIKEGLSFYPKVSIIVPCWNEELTVSKTIDSLLNLDYPKDKLEILAVDDGSTDNTWQVLKKFEQNPQIKIFKKENGGKHTVLNFGIEKCTGEYVGCLDADSYVDSNALKNIIMYFQKDSNAVSITPSVKIYKPQNILQMMQKVEYGWGILLRKMLSYLGALYVTPGPFSIFKKDLFKIIGPYRHAHNTEDMEMAMRIQKHKLKINNSHNAVVYTVAPDTIRKLVRQRLRWTYGFIKNVIDYRFIFFKKEYGNLGIFILPMASLSIISGIYILSSIVINFISKISEEIVRIRTLGIELKFPDLSFDIFSFNTEIIAVISFATFIGTLTILYISRKMEEGRFKFGMDLIYFLTLYTFIAPIWLARAVLKAVSGSKTSWR